MIELVVACYKENLEWLQGVSTDIKITAYHKANGDLPNVGREAHTYVYHIVRQYDALEDVTVFAQGNPFPHSQDFYRRLDELQGRGVWYHNMTQGELTDDKDGCGHHCGLGIYKTWEQLFIEPCPEYFTFNPGAMFAVSREAIHQYPLEFWEIVLSLLSQSVDPIEAWRLERMWKTVFETKWTPLLLPAEPSTEKAYTQNAV